TAAAVLLAVTAVAGLGIVTHQILASQTSEARGAEATSAAAGPDRPAAEPDREQAPVDPHGDALPAGALARLGTVRFRHGDSVWAVAVSPDGKLIASCSGSFDPTIRFWDPATGREVRQIQVADRLHDGLMALAFAPDGKTLASGSSNLNVVCLWDATT